MPLKLIPPGQRHANTFWYVRGSVKGVRVEESTGARDRGKAEEYRIRREQELLDRHIHGDPIVRTFAEAAVSYMENGGEGALLDPILAHFGEDTLVARIGQDEIEACARKLQPKGSPATRNRKVFTPISAVLHHAATKGWRAAPVIERPKGHDEQRVRYIERDEAERLITAAAPHIKPLLIFLFSTGARLSEALYLDWADVDLSRGHVALRPTDDRGIKNGEARGVPLPDRAVAALANLPWDREGKVFRRPAGRIKTTGRVWLPYESRKGEGGGQIKTAWAGMLKRAGITDFTPHDCRHTWATWHYRANRDLRGLMELGGWKTLSMVLRYAHVNTSHLAPSQAAIWGTGENLGDNSPADAVKPMNRKRK